MLVRLLYASRTAHENSLEIAEGILAQSRQHNPPQGITGFLCFGNGVFLQVLEGGRGAVNQLYSRIMRDARHNDVTLLSYDEISERRFSSWSMGQVNLSNVNASTLIKYSERAELDPFTMPSSVSLALIEELMATASIAGRY